MHELQTIQQDAVITAMMILNEAQNTATKRGDMEAVFHLNDQFHRTLFGCCDNKELLAALAAQARRTHSIRTNSLKHAAYLTHAQREHQQIIEGMIKEDRPALKRLCKTHIDRPVQDDVSQHQAI